MRRSYAVTVPKTKVCTMTVQPGELWLADIRFTDASASKIRPVLVLWLDALDAVVAAVTAAGPRRWLITVQPLPAGSPVRDRAAFLRSYRPEDEGLYDDCAAG